MTIEDGQFLRELAFKQQLHRERILPMLDDLPDELRTVAVLSGVEGRTLPEISEQLDLPESIINARLTQVRRLQERHRPRVSREAPQGDALLLQQLFAQQLVAQGPQLTPPPLPTLPLKITAKPKLPPVSKAQPLVKRFAALAAVAAIAVTGVAMLDGGASVENPPADHLLANSDYDAPAAQNEAVTIILPEDIPLAQLPPETVDEVHRQMPELLINHTILDFTLGEHYRAQELLSISEVSAFAPNGQELPVELLRYHDIDWGTVGCYCVTAYVPATDDTQACWDDIYININLPGSETAEKPSHN